LPGNVSPKTITTDMTACASSPWLSALPIANSQTIITAGSRQASIARTAENESRRTAAGRSAWLFMDCPCIHGSQISSSSVRGKKEERAIAPAGRTSLSGIFLNRLVLTPGLLKGQVNSSPFLTPSVTYRGGQPPRGLVGIVGKTSFLFNEICRFGSNATRKLCWRKNVVAFSLLLVCNRLLTWTVAYLAELHTNHRSNRLRGYGPPRLSCQFAHANVFLHATWQLAARSGHPRTDFLGATFSCYSDK
jgi:hypothetical protein